MKQIEKLIEDLEGGLSSPAAKELSYCIKINNEKRAIEIIKGEHFSHENAKRLYDHFVKDWSCNSMKLVPIKNKNDIKYYNMTKEGSDYLIRIKKSVFISRPFKFDEKVEMTFPHEQFDYKFEDFDEIFEIVLE